MGHKEQYSNLRLQLLNDRTLCSYNRSLFKKFLDWEEEKLKRINNLSEIDSSSYKTLKCYPRKLINVNNWFENKAWNKLTIAEIRKVYNDLEDGKITNRFGKKFQDRRSYYNKIFKSKPFKLAGLQDKVNEALEFFTDKTKKEVKYVSEEAFNKMVSVISNSKHLALFWLSWDIGENISSLLDLKKSNFTRQTNRDTKETEYLVNLPQGVLKRSRKTRTEPTIYPETVNYLDIVLLGLDEDEKVFKFGHRQALKVFHSVVNRSKVKCSPNGEVPTWKDLRSGMACNLHLHGWLVQDINLRLGHSVFSRWLDAYINYLAINRKRVIKSHFDSNLSELKDELEESKLREKLVSQRLERLKEELDNLKENMNSSRLLEWMKQQNQMRKVLEELSGKKFDVVLESYS